MPITASSGRGSAEGEVPFGAYVLGHKSASPSTSTRLSTQWGLTELSCVEPNCLKKAVFPESVCTNPSGWFHSPCEEQPEHMLERIIKSFSLTTSSTGHVLFCLLRIHICFLLMALTFTLGEHLTPLSYHKIWMRLNYSVFPNDLFWRQTSPTNGMGFFFFFFFRGWLCDPIHDNVISILGLFAGKLLCLRA